MKYDLVIGNPPFGKNSNLAVDFLNKAKDWSDKLGLIADYSCRSNGGTIRITYT